MKRPAAEVRITEVLVQQLLHKQFPTLSGLPLKYFNEGWDNVIFQLGSTYLLRLPRRSIAVPFLEKEQTWLARLNDVLPIPVPAPIYQGKPQGAYPWPWSITPSFAGQTAAEAPPTTGEATRLSTFLASLHAQPTGDTPPFNPHRSTPLAAKASDTEQRLRRYIQAGLAHPKLQALWDQAVRLTCPPKQCRLIHGDLHPKNIITQNGQIAAIIDWGDLTLGDPATDLAAFWLLFAGEKAREQALVQYGATPNIRMRAIGWAIFFSTILLGIGLSGDSLFKRVGQHGLDELAVTSI